MTISITIWTAPRHERGAQLLHRAEGSTMARAEASARRYCEAHELAGTGADRTVYAYDCLGGLRFEARRRDNTITIR